MIFKAGGTGCDGVSAVIRTKEAPSPYSPSRDRQDGEAVTASLAHERLASGTRDEPVQVRSFVARVFVGRDSRVRRY